jgi:hypothetical protein
MFHREAGYMPATGYQIVEATALRTGLGPIHAPRDSPREIRTTGG